MSRVIPLTKTCTCVTVGRLARIAWVLIAAAIFSPQGKVFFVRTQTPDLSEGQQVSPQEAFR